MPGTFFVGICLRKTADAGWVSVYYPIGQDYAGRLANLDKINTAEMSMLHITTVCERIWVSDMEVPGDIESKKPTNGVGAIGTASEVSVDPNICMPIRVEAGIKQRATRYIRGLSTANVNPGDPLTIISDAAFLLNFAGYATALQNFAQLIHKPTDNNPNWLATQITSVTFKNAGQNKIKASIRRAGRPFGARRGRRRTG